MMNALQQRKFAELKEAVKNRPGWELLSTSYVNNATKLDFKCPNNHIRKMESSNFKNGNGCAICSGCDSNSAKERFEKRVKELGGTLIDDYVNKRTSVRGICIEGHEIIIRPDSVVKGLGICITCVGQDPIISKNKFIERVTELGGKVIGNYKNASTAVSVICTNGHINDVTPANTYQWGICHKCGTGRHRLELEFAAKVEQSGGKILSPYINCTTPVAALCKNNHTCYIKACNIMAGFSMCKACNGTSGEQLTAAALDLLGISFITQYSLPGKSLRYDFMICGTVVIEFDGKQHFEIVKHFHRTINDFDDGQNRDREKTRDIINLGHKIIRIDYTWGSKSVQELAQFIYTALDTNQPLIVSNLEMYQWLINY